MGVYFFNIMIKLASINIEGEKHYESVVEFLKTFKPDAVCFQELTQKSVAYFEDKLGMKGNYFPIMKAPSGGFGTLTPLALFGLGIFTSLPISDSRSEYYYGGVGELKALEVGNEKTIWRGLLQATVEKDGQKFTIATTHFTRTPDGSTSEKQRQDLKKLLAILDSTPETILCGDFNAPRGGEIFSALATRYKDNVPAEYDSSLDPKLHRAGHLKLMVDGLFSSKEYEFTEAKLSEGVSDHKAITATITKVV